MRAFTFFQRSSLFQVPCAGPLKTEWQQDLRCKPFASLKKWIRIDFENGSALAKVLFAKAS